MSRHMQIDIRLIPYYEKPFKKLFPGFSKLLREYDYTKPLEKDVSLYELVDYVTDMVQGLRMPPDLKGTLRVHEKRLRGLKEIAREQLLGRRLNELDETLYRLEEEFAELEKAL